MHPERGRPKTHGNLRVELYGKGDPALVLVPGLMAGAWSWHDTIVQEAQAHAVYAVTVAGMAGLPPDSQPSQNAIAASLLSLIQSEKIDRPVVVGHSLGGKVALRFGTEHSNLVRGIVSVDGMPVFTTLAESTPERRAAAAEKFARDLLSLTPAQYVQRVAAMVHDFVTDQRLADRVAALCAESDQKTVAAYFKDVMASDIRSSLPNLTAPVLIVTPNPGLPLPSDIPAAMARQNLDEQRALIVRFYTGLMSGAANVKVVAIDDTRHFVMLDRPDEFVQVLDAFIAGLK